MNPFKRLGIALYRTLCDQADLIATQVLLPQIAGAVTTGIAKAFTRSSTPPQGGARLASYRSLVHRTVDGCPLDGALPGTYAKFAIPKGLPAQEGERRMAIENQPHQIEERSFVITEGYGKGTKSLVYSGTATVKIDGESHLGRIAVHYHDPMPVDMIARRLREHGVPEGFVRKELDRFRRQPAVPIPETDPAKQPEGGTATDETEVTDSSISVRPVVLLWSGIGTVTGGPRRECSAPGYGCWTRTAMGSGTSARRCIFLPGAGRRHPAPRQVVRSRSVMTSNPAFSF